MQQNKQQTKATMLGAVAVLLWSTAFACNRSLAEQIGPITAAAGFHSIGGLVGLLLLWKKNRLKQLKNLPLSYLISCGTLFVMSQTCIFLAIGWSTTRHQAVVTSLVYYLWPCLILLFSLPIHKQRARLILIPGVLVALIGIGLITVPEGSPEWKVWQQDFAGNYRPYLFALIGAVSWALFSNVSRLYADKIKDSVVPLFMALTGVVLGLLRFTFDESTVFTTRAFGELMFMGLVPMLLAYSLWDVAVRDGNLSAVASFSYLAPFLSACLSCLYLGVSPSWIFWSGCVLIICGAILSKMSIISSPVENHICNRVSAHPETLEGH